MDINIDKIDIQDVSAIVEQIKYMFLKIKSDKFELTPLDKNINVCENEYIYKKYKDIIDEAVQNLYNMAFKEMCEIMKGKLIDELGIGGK